MKCCLTDIISMIYMTLLKKCNARLTDAGHPEVTQRCIEKESITIEGKKYENKQNGVDELDGDMMHLKTYI